MIVSTFHVGTEEIADSMGVARMQDWTLSELVDPNGPTLTAVKSEHADVLVKQAAREVWKEGTRRVPLSDVWSNMRTVSTSSVWDRFIALGLDAPTGELWPSAAYTFGERYFRTRNPKGAMTVPSLCESGSRWMLYTERS